MTTILADHEISVTGSLLRTARLRDEWYDFVTEPPSLIKEMMLSRLANLCTFLQEVHELEPKYPYYCERDSISVLPISTYDHWWSKQINDKTRNMVRKAAKNKVQLRTVDLDEQLISGVVAIYNETPIRQGKQFRHYHVDYNYVKKHLETFADRSQFVGAYFGEELIGFFKLTRNTNSASLMQIISKNGHRDKAPNNALLAKAVEVCAESKSPFLQYGVWSDGGLGEYKVRHGFVRFDVPRYYVPLDVVGRVALACSLHKGVSKMLPQTLRRRASSLRRTWYSFLNGKARYVRDHKVTSRALSRF